MKLEAIDWEQDIPLDADEAYHSLVRSLKRTDGFSLLFVRCSPIQGKQIITDVGNDLKDKNIKILELEESIDNLYDRIAALDDLDRLNILFIKGIEQSIFAYEDREVHDINLRSRSLQYGGTWQNVPRVLGHLNLSRERFRDNFKFCIVFLLPEFALRYFIRRAPDFFDWRSNIYDFPTEKSLVDQESFRLVYLDGNFDEYQQLTNEQRIAKLCQIKSYIDESSDPKRASDLWFEKGLIHAAANEHEEALTAYDRALEFKPDFQNAWYRRGIALGNLGKPEEALTAYDRALEFKPDFQNAWYGRGVALGNLGRYEEALTSFDKALEFNPDFQNAWYGRGFALKNLGRYEEAITSYDRALAIIPDYPQLWQNRGYVLNKLGRYEEAIGSYDKALEINPNLQEALVNRGFTLVNVGRYEEAINSYQKVLKIKPDDYKTWDRLGAVLCDNLGKYEEAITAFDKALEIKPNFHNAWHDRGIALGNLGKNEEALISYDKAIQFKPDYHVAWNNRGIPLLYLGRYEEAIISFEKTLAIKSDYYESWKNLGNALIYVGRYEEAIASYEKTLGLTDNINKKVEIIQIISSLYYRLGKIREGFATAQKMTELLQATNTSISEISVCPQWMRKLIKFGESGKIQGFIFVGLIIIAAPIWIPAIISIFVYRIFSQFLIKRK